MLLTRVADGLASAAVHGTNVPLISGFRTQLNAARNSAASGNVQRGAFDIPFPTFPQTFYE